MAQDRDEAIAELRQAYQRHRLTLYLGAGVSVGSGLPTWDRLVLAMYFNAIAQKKMGDRRPFPNYLYAIADWHLKRTPVPLEITRGSSGSITPSRACFSTGYGKRSTTRSTCRRTGTSCHPPRA
jgi:hypothetical protein